MTARPLHDAFETARLRLRRPRTDDAEAIFVRYAQDPDVCRYLRWTPHANVDTTHAFIADSIAHWDAGTRWPFVVTLRDDDAPIGMIEGWPRAATTVEIGYVLARSHWGRGYMPEAISAITTAALADPRCFRVQAMCDVDNVASARVLEKSGFVREGRLERCAIHPNLSPEPRASFLYARVEP